MKKRIEKKLSLNRETLRRLAERDLMDVVGGASYVCSADACPTNADNCSGSCQTVTRCD